MQYDVQSNAINLTKLNYGAAITVHKDINNINLLSQVMNINLTHENTSLVFRSFYILPRVFQ